MRPHEGEEGGKIDHAGREDDIRPEPFTQSLEGSPRQRHGAAMHPPSPESRRHGDGVVLMAAMGGQPVKKIAVRTSVPWLQRQDPHLPCPVCSSGLDVAIPPPLRAFREAGAPPPR